jgi:hypothetical protein
MCGGFWANREKLLLSIPAGLPFKMKVNQGKFSGKDGIHVFWRQT